MMKIKQEDRLKLSGGYDVSSRLKYPKDYEFYLAKSYTSNSTGIPLTPKMHLCHLTQRRNSRQKTFFCNKHYVKGIY